MTKDIYTDAEKQQLISAVKASNNKIVSVSSLCRAAGLNPNRGRFVMDVLLETGKVTRTAVKQYNERYIRYTYAVTTQ